MSEEKEEKKDFVVRDKRRFTEDGPAASEIEDTQEAPEASPEPDEPAGREQAEQQQRMDQLPQINFTTFIMSLNSSALVQLGVLEDPVSGKKEKNILLAKQTIDMLGMLEEKTKGNLTHEEEQILKNFLYELRMIYVKEMH